MAGAPRDVLLTCDPSDVNHVFVRSTTSPNFPKGAHLAHVLDFIGHGIFTADSQLLEVPAPHRHSLMSRPGFREFVVRCTKAKVDQGLVPPLDHYANVKVMKVLDLQDVFMRVSFDVTCMLVFGVDPRSADLGFPRVEFARAMDDAGEAVFLRHVVPEMWWKAMRWAGVGSEGRLNKAVKVMDEFIKRYVEMRREEKKKKKKKKKKRRRVEGS